MAALVLPVYEHQQRWRPWEQNLGTLHWTADEIDDLEIQELASYELYVVGMSEGHADVFTAESENDRPDCETLVLPSAEELVRNMAYVFDDEEIQLRTDCLSSAVTQDTVMMAKRGGIMTHDGQLASRIGAVDCGKVVSRTVGKFKRKRVQDDGEITATFSAESK